MTVNELIEKLRQFDGELTVYFDDEIQEGLEDIDAEHIGVRRVTRNDHLDRWDTERVRGRHEDHGVFSRHGEYGVVISRNDWIDFAPHTRVK